MAARPDTPPPCKVGPGCKGLEVYRPADVPEHLRELAEIHAEDDVAFVCCLDLGRTPDGGMLGIPAEWARYLEEIVCEQEGKPTLFPDGAPVRTRPSSLAERRGR